MIFTYYETSGARPKLFTYPTSMTQPLIGATTYTWDKVLGQVTEVVDPNAARTSYSYDQRGRQTGLWKPGEVKASGHGATQITAYTNYASAPFKVQTRRRDDQAGGGGTATYLDSWSFYDGLGRVIQIQAEAAAASQSILASTSYTPFTTSGRAARATRWPA